MKQNRNYFLQAPQLEISYHPPSRAGLKAAYYLDTQRLTWEPRDHYSGCSPMGMRGGAAKYRLLLASVNKGLEKTSFMFSLAQAHMISNRFNST